MEDPNPVDACNGTHTTYIHRSDLHFETPRNFLQVYFVKELQSAHTIEISSPSIDVNWMNPDIYVNVDDDRQALLVHDIEPPVPCFIWSSTESSCSDSEIMDDEDLWDPAAVKERDKVHDKCSAFVYFPFLCMNEFVLTCMDVDDDPAVPLCIHNFDAKKRSSIVKGSLCCSFPHYHHRRLASSSVTDDWKDAFSGYQTFDTNCLKV